MKVYRSGSELIHVTNKSPRQFPGVLFLCLRGSLPESVEEGVIAPGQFQGLEEVDIETLSPEWRQALNLPALVESKPTKEPVVSTSAVARRHKPLQRRRTNRRQTRKPSTPRLKEQTWNEALHDIAPWLVFLCCFGVGFVIIPIIGMCLVLDWAWDQIENHLNRNCPS